MKIINVFALCVVFWMAAAASFSGYMGKWGYLYALPGYGVETILNGTATKPFVYRQLAPIIANELAVITPKSIKDFAIAKIRPQDTFSNGYQFQQFKSDETKFKCIIIYYMSFLSLFASLFVLMQILLYFNFNNSISILSPIIFVLAFPYIQTVGGFFYDSIELLFLSIAFLWALKGRYIGLLCLTIPATLNKEVFFFFIPTLYPLIRNHLDKKKSTLLLLGMISLSGIMNIIIKKVYYMNGGQAGIYQLVPNIKTYLSPLSYFQFEITYGLVSPQKMSIIYITIICFIFGVAWKYCPRFFKNHIILVVCINLPLFLLFGAAGEIRNLSFFFVLSTVLIGYVINKQKLI